MVGTWELDRKISKALTENARTLGGDPAKIQSMLDGLSEDGLVPTYVFRSNGECVEPVLVNRNVRGMDGEWQLIGEGMNEATVVLTVGSDECDEQAGITDLFLFEVFPDVCGVRLDRRRRIRRKEIAVRSRRCLVSSGSGDDAVPENQLSEPAATSGCG